MLEIGAGKIATRFFPRPEFLGDARYTVTDIRRLAHHERIHPPHRFVVMDATAMGFAPESFDAIVCNNVLPYVREDGAALAEIRRCLKADAIAMLNTAWRPGPTRTVGEFRRSRPDLEDGYFADHGNRWVYGEDLFQRLGEAGLCWRTDRPFVASDERFINDNGLKARSEFIVAFKRRQAMARFPCPRPSS